MKTKLIFFFLLPFAFILSAFAGSATWKESPGSSDWNTAANWTPATVPNGPSDVATFAVSNITVIDHQNVEVDAIVFEPGASSFTISSSLALTMSGAGIINNSGVMQILENGPRDFTDLLDPIVFSNDATAGELTQLTAGGGDGDQFAGEIHFLDSSTAGSSALVASAGKFDGYSGQIRFEDSSSAGNATITIESDPTARDEGGSVVFLDSSNAVNAVITVDEGGSASFGNSSSAADATISCSGSDAIDRSGASLSFSGSSSAGNATLIINGGTGGGGGAKMNLWDNSTAETAQVKVFGNGILSITSHDAPGVTIGSLEGDGNVQLTTEGNGERNLTIGSNNLNTTFSGTITDDGPPFPTAGSITKVGTGTLTLSGANTYTGGTTVEAGNLAINNRTDSGTGTGPVHVHAGTLSGRGIIAGTVTLGTGSGSGAFISPGSNQPAVLTIQTRLIFNADSTYIYTVNTRQTRADQLIGNGTKINSGAIFNPVALGHRSLPEGTVFTAISNTSAKAINGTFANLPDGAIITMDGNKLQADYQGGDGNDLTLTVVP